MSMFEETKKEAKGMSPLAEEAKKLMKKHKVDTIYHCGGYWFLTKQSADNHLAVLFGKGRVEEFKNE